MVYTDENGYKRANIKHSDLIHRQVAYKHIYLKNKENYPLRFSDYVIHHKDGNKQNNKVSNLQILTPEEHEAIHGFSNSSFGDFSSRDFSFKDTIIVFGIIVFALIIINMFHSYSMVFNLSVIFGAIIILMLRKMKVLT
jgi:hypothetical protein